MTAHGRRLLGGRLLRDVCLTEGDGVVLGGRFAVMLVDAELWDLHLGHPSVVGQNIVVLKERFKLLLLVLLALGLLHILPLLEDRAACALDAGGKGYDGRQDGQTDLGPRLALLGKEERDIQREHGERQDDESDRAEGLGDQKGNGAADKAAADARLSVRIKILGGVGNILVEIGKGLNERGDRHDKHDGKDQP